MEGGRGAWRVGEGRAGRRGTWRAGEGHGGRQAHVRMTMQGACWLCCVCECGAQQSGGFSKRWPHLSSTAMMTSSR